MRAPSLGHRPHGQTLYRMQTHPVENELGMALRDQSLVSIDPALATVCVTTLF